MELCFLFSSAGHPDYLHIGEQVSKALRVDDKEDGVRHSEVVVIGQGNVALDCARILAKGKSGLFDTGEFCRVV
jgi:adrenodoxin-NADP+ reductase